MLWKPLDSSAGKFGIVSVPGWSAGKFVIVTFRGSNTAIILQIQGQDDVKSKNSERECYKFANQTKKPHTGIVVVYLLIQ